MGFSLLEDKTATMLYQTLIPALKASMLVLNSTPLMLSEISN